MATTYDDDAHGPIISEEAARGGAIGHNVRYVLAWSLTGVIVAFAAIAIYFGYERLHALISQALANNPSDVIRGFAPYATILVVGAIAAGLLLGVVNLFAGRTENASQFGMRLRVIAQFVLVCVIMTVLYVSSMG